MIPINDSNDEYIKDTVLIHNRLYDSYYPDYINPIEEKLFHLDEIKYKPTENKNINYESLCIIKSPTREKILPGVLLLDKVYGKWCQTKNMYKCIPDNLNLPIFLIPYEIKKMDFIKTGKKIYVLFKFKEWNNTQKHPIGILENTIGDIRISTNYYTYQLYCRDIYYSINKFNKIANEKIKEKQMNNLSNNDIIRIISSHYKIKSECFNNKEIIFSIDSENCSERDDAFSISNNKIKIYISAVSIILDYFDLFNEINQTSSIYLPNKTRNMIPTIISEQLCSLTQNSEKIVYVTEFEMTHDYSDIINVKHYLSTVFINYNYYYEDDDLLNSTHYNLLLSTMKKWKKQQSSLEKEGEEDIYNSRNLVEQLMILNNYYSSKILSENNGIFRNCNANYCNIKQPHTLLGLSSYTHITSPIRRLVDIINSIFIFSNNLNIRYQCSYVFDFCYSWISNIDFINIQSRSIYKIQNETHLLDMFEKDNSILNKSWNAKINYLDDDKMDFYIQKIGIYSSIYSKEMITLIKNSYKEGDNISIRLIYFYDEIRFKEKIKCTII
jgi:exoribonuclease R